MQLPKIVKFNILFAQPSAAEVLELRASVSEAAEAAKEIEKANAIARAQMELGKADKQMVAGTRIDVFGFGEGSYVSFKKKTGRANEHTIDFGTEEGSPGVQEVQLKNKDWQWSVANGVVRCDIA